MRTVCQLALSGSHPSLTFPAPAWPEMKQCAFSKADHTPRNMSYVALCLTSTLSPCTRSPSYPSARPTSTSPIVHAGEINPCHDPQQVSAVWLMPHQLKVLSPRILQKTMICVSSPQTEYNFDLRFCWEHCETPSWIGFGWWAKSCSAGFTTVLAGERSKCGPITSLSLCKRKLSVKFISSSEEHQETRCVVFEQKDIFWQRRNFLKTSTGSCKKKKNTTNPQFWFSDPENSI